MNKTRGLTIAEAARKLRQGEVSSVELTKDYLAKINRSDLNAFVTVDREGALAAAKQADILLQGQTGTQTLTGVPLAIKDVISTKGIRTTACSKILDNYTPPFDATVITKLKQKGAVILGKTNLDEFAMGSSTENSAYGPTLGPIDKKRVPGGSSGGSAAAVAADLCLAALGSDTGGSIRQPASFCGVTGFKPTYGRVSRYGLIAMASSLDQIGPLAKDALDAKILFEAIGGYDRLDATSLKDELPAAQKIQNLKIGLPKEFFQSRGLDEKVKRSVEEGVNFLEKLGCQIKDVSLPTSPFALAIYYLIMPVEVASNLARYDGIKYGLSSIEEARNLLAVYSKTRSKYFGSEPKRRIILGTYASSAGYYEAYYGQAEKARAALVQDFKKVFDQVDVVAGPTAPTPPFKFGEKTDDPLTMYLSDIYTVPVNLAGLPSISLPVLPVGRQVRQAGVPTRPVNNLPVGLQLTGPRDSDLTLLELAIGLEQSFQSS